MSIPVHTRDVIDADDRADAAAVARGVRRLFWRHGIALIPEMPLRGGRRADLMGLGPKGEVIIIEIKCARADLLGDRKWRDYLDRCDRFYWAICPQLDPALLDDKAFMPERTGLIVADSYDGDILRPAATVPLAASRRTVEVRRLAEVSLRRLSRLADPSLAQATEDMR